MELLINMIKPNIVILNILLEYFRSLISYYHNKWARPSTQETHKVQKVNPSLICSCKSFRKRH